MRGDFEAVERARMFIEHSFLNFEGQDNYLLTSFKIASTRKITIYDALFIALAKNFPLITSDKKQAAIAKLENIKVIFIP